MAGLYLLHKGWPNTVFEHIASNYSTSTLPVGGGYDSVPFPKCYTNSYIKPNIGDGSEPFPPCYINPNTGDRRERSPPAI